MDRDDVGVHQLRGGARFAQEPVAKHRVSAEVPRQELDGNRALERDITGEKDDAHAAAPQFALEQVASGDYALEIQEIRRRSSGECHHVWRPDEVMLVPAYHRCRGGWTCTRSSLVLLFGSVITYSS